MQTLTAGPNRGRHTSPERQRRDRAWLLVLLALLSGCRARSGPVYQDNQGFRFTPPPGWVERARDTALPARVAQRQQNVPLPPLGVPGQAAQEHLLARYDRISSAQHAWLRVTVARLPSEVPLPTCVANRFPGPDWKRETAEESLEIGTLPAARVTFAGRWLDHDYLNETVAVRKDENVYFITASFPASDTAAREQVRQAVASATWQ